MATTYTWSFDSLDYLLKDGDGLGDYSATTYGSVVIAAPNPDDFTPFADITQAQVKAWTLSSLADQDVTEETLQAGLQAQIDLLKTPAQKSGIPTGWS